jgi:hypothetical protein
MYIQIKMDFLNISSLGVSYRYAVKIEHKFRNQNKWEFGSANLQQPKYSKDDPNQQPLDNQSKTQEKRGKVNMKNETGKCCDFQKIPWNNIDECFLKHSLVAVVKDIKPKPDSEFDPENIENKQIINADPTSIFRNHKNSSRRTSIS